MTGDSAPQGKVVVVTGASGGVGVPPRGSASAAPRWRCSPVVSPRSPQLWASHHHTSLTAMALGVTAAGTLVGWRSRRAV